jgi:hypothetical protein
MKQIKSEILNMILTGMEQNTKIWGAKIETIIQNIKFCILSKMNSEVEEKPLTFLHIQSQGTQKDSGGTIDLAKYSEQDLTLYRDRLYSQLRDAEKRED